ncbi:MAG: prepilin peptidase [Sulfolobales archaeon]
MVASIVESLAVVALVTTLAYASYRDLKDREIPEVSWIPVYALVILSAVLKPIESYSLLGAILAILPPVVYCVLFVFGLIGGADLIAVVAVSLAHLDEPLIPLFTFVLSSLLPLPIVFVNLVGNLTIYRNAMGSIKCVQGSKKVLYLIGRPTDVASFLKKKFVFLHTHPSQEGFICSGSVDVNIDFGKQKIDVEEALSEGFIGLEDYVVYSPALPHIVFIALSYVIAVTVEPFLEALVFST